MYYQGNLENAQTMFNEVIGTLLENEDYIGATEVLIKIGQIHTNNREYSLAIQKI